jgi:dethiobiotin synthetase
MNKGYFITGTDTDSGKTLVTLGLMQFFQSRGYRVAGMKPVAAGAEMTGDGWRNSDALLIQSQATAHADYERINPYLFEPPIAPHLAAEQVGVVIDFAHISHAFTALADSADMTLVEGAGGWCVPLGRSQTVADLAIKLGLPAILVVGLKLGCINHALLTVESMRASGVQLAGWVANQVDPYMHEVPANIATLKKAIDAPCLGFVPYLEKPSAPQVAQAFHDQSVLGVLSL